MKMHRPAGSDSRRISSRSSRPERSAITRHGRFRQVLDCLCDPVRSEGAPRAPCLPGKLHSIVPKFFFHRPWESARPSLLSKVSESLTRFFVRTKDSCFNNHLSLFFAFYPIPMEPSLSLHRCGLCVWTYTSVPSTVVSRTFLETPTHFLT